MVFIFASAFLPNASSILLAKNGKTSADANFPSSNNLPNSCVLPETDSPASCAALAIMP